ncbi:UNVERIFIED_ORG: NADPH-dependent ferric siderophore reductase [Nocardia globerula]|uniref:NADPH-dependent ferric siderophore reductase n=1 Tax=Nocardia globerula TaxID=1818 RepID=A0A652YWN6_NOCGL|nr:siderophore-interacting protein [Rhodococcus globerulus]NMD59539.1 siderophore-interacting protein [Nocardia globerula]PVX64381.1 NADPH-dependent ferric siderophore reductase [Rhodococcus globerulus]
MAKRSKFVKPVSRSITSAQVVANKRISPTFIRITIAGEELGTITPMGADHWFRLFIPQAGQSELRLPSAANNLWYAQYLVMSKDTRPVVRNYTIREYRPAGSGLFGDTAEIDIDFAFHGDIGPASAWADTASSGDKVALLDEGCIYNPTPDCTWQLLVGDESALPAIAGILETADADLRAEVFIEVPNVEDKQDLPQLAHVNVHWIIREDTDTKPGALALEAVRAAELPEGPSYTFVAGEQALTTGLRRHLVNDRKFPKTDITFTGFWRDGHAAN